MSKKGCFESCNKSIKKKLLQNWNQWQINSREWKFRKNTFYLELVSTIAQKYYLILNFLSTECAKTEEKEQTPGN